MPAAQPDYAVLSDEALAIQFMPRLAVPEHDQWLEEDLQRSALVRLAKPELMDRPYGPGQRQRIDLFPAAQPGSPLFVWFHGGYWRALSKEHYTYLAPSILAAGAAVALIGYDLCPTVSLTQLLAQTRSALKWLAQNAQSANADPNRMVLGGNSAGAHIAAMALTHDWKAEGGPPGVFRGAALVTGIYDLTPVPRLPVQAEIRLTPEEAANFSPMHLPMRARPRCLVAVGGDEPDLWVEQSRRFHSRLLAQDIKADLMIVEDRHHFSITRDLASPSGRLSRAVAELIAEAKT